MPSPTPNINITVTPNGTIISEPAITPSPTATPTAQVLNWQKEAGIRIVDGVSSNTLFVNGTYRMYYTKEDGIHLALSTDGLNFYDAGAEIAPGTNSAVFQIENGYRMIYEIDNGSTDRKLYSAFSNDGMNWTKESGIRLQDDIESLRKNGPGSSFASVPEIVKLTNGTLRMYYTTGTRSSSALSGDNGLTWKKEGQIIVEDRQIVLDPDIIMLDDGTYLFFYSTSDSVPFQKQWLEIAESTDGRYFKPFSGGIHPFGNTTNYVDPDVVKLSNGHYRIYFGEAENMQNQFRIVSVISK